MKAEIVGDTKSLKPSEKVALEKLSFKRSQPSEFLHRELAKRVSTIAHDMGRCIGLLLGRDGRITHIVLGGKDRLYLPDLGRFRLDRTRLRRLRLIVFQPGAEGLLRSFPKVSTRGVGGSRSAPWATDMGDVIAPEVPADLLADLEKLRLDALLFVSVGKDAQPGPVTLAHIELTGGRSDVSSHSANREAEGRDAGREIRFYHYRLVSEIDLAFDSFISELERRIISATSKTVDTGKERAVLVGAYTSPMNDARSSMEELVELAFTAGVDVVDNVIQRRRKLDPKTVIGKGKLEELVLHCLDIGAEVLIFDRELSPGQLRSITNLTELRVVDRSMLILDIFAQRAKTKEGRLQVELAQLKYSLPRLTEKDSGLSRLTGGIGGRGPGETKLEVSRRRTRKRIADLEKKIDKIADQRAVRRERRRSRGVPVISIVGYTNAGKSTLLNALTKGDVLVEKKLFATLDPASRRMRFPNDHEVIFVDTVGFIRELPKELIAAFRATLEEVELADILVHVVDATNPELERQIQIVRETLSSLNFNDKPEVLVLNKVDRLSDVEAGTLLNTFGGIPVSAVERTGFQELLLLLQDALAETFEGADPGKFIAEGTMSR